MFQFAQKIGGRGLCTAMVRRRIKDADRVPKYRPTWEPCTCQKICAEFLFQVQTLCIILHTQKRRVASLELSLNIILTVQYNECISVRMIMLSIAITAGCNIGNFIKSLELPFRGSVASHVLFLVVQLTDKLFFSSN